MTVSLASDPELTKWIRSMPSGSKVASFAASSIAGGVPVWKNAL